MYIKQLLAELASFILYILYIKVQVLSLTLPVLCHHVPAVLQGKHELVGYGEIRVFKDHLELPFA